MSLQGLFAHLGRPPVHLDVWVLDEREGVGPLGQLAHTAGLIEGLGELLDGCVTAMALQLTGQMFIFCCFFR